MSAMRVCFALLYWDSAAAALLHRGTLDRYLEQLATLRGLTPELVARGHRVEVVHTVPQKLVHEERGVRYRFVAPGRLASWLGRIAGNVGDVEPAVATLCRPAVRAIVDSLPDVVHFHGTNLHLQLASLRRALDGSVPVVLHHHGGLPARRPWVRQLQRRNYRRVARLLVTTRQQAEPFLEGRLLAPGQVAELLETSSSYSPRPRAAARQETGIGGDPVFLSTARLDPIKDPWTTLRGFEEIALQRPRARLYLYYLSDRLKDELQSYVAQRPELGSRVVFAGRLPREKMEPIYNSADFLLQSSRREHSGCSVLDAMACGVVPVVTDLPSFRLMTDGGRFGALFPPGDPAALSRRALAVDSQQLPSLAAAVRRHFEERLSFRALAATLEGIYRELLPPTLGGCPSNRTPPR